MTNQTPFDRNNAERRRRYLAAVKELEDGGFYGPQGRQPKSRDEVSHL